MPHGEELYILSGGLQRLGLQTGSSFDLWHNEPSSCKKSLSRPTRHCRDRRGYRPQGSSATSVLRTCLQTLRQSNAEKNKPPYDACRLNKFLTLLSRFLNTLP